MPSHRRHPILPRLLLAVVALLCLPVAARADTTTSTNWSGYAIHGRGAHFHRVTGSWRVPTATCATTSPGYSATWLGLGGYAGTSPALEQIGTETDCKPSGRVVTSAWYELLPEPSRSVKLTVRPGDTIAATVTVSGHRVTLSLVDRTRHRSFTRQVTVATVDVSSAEWIVEAPSQCTGKVVSCQTLPLADFGTVAFTGARVQTRSGRAGSIGNGPWNRTKIMLAAGGRSFVSAAALAGAVPSALSASGDAFSVAFAQTAGPSAPPGNAAPVSALAAAVRR